MKRTISLLLVFVMILACLPVMVFAVESTSGTFGAQGDNLAWTLDDAGTLTISGTGYMDTLGTAPWNTYRDSIKKAEIGNGVLNISMGAFRSCEKLTKVTIGNSVTRIDDSVFALSTKLNEIYFEGSAPAIGSDAFLRVTATAYYYPDSTWTADVMQNYGGTITWVARCAHSNTEVVNAAQATCTEDGYTGDTVCADCGATVAEGSVIPVLDHTYRYPCDPYCMDCYKLTNPDAKHNVTHVPAVEANCQVMGNLEHWACVDCGACWLDEALMQITNRFNVITFIEHNYVDGVCSVCGEKALIKWAGVQVQANANLNMQFALKASDFEGLTGNYIVLTRHYADGSTKQITINQADWTKNGNYYIVEYSGIAAKEMGDVIVAVVYNAEGKAISEVRAESIETYAKGMLKDEKVLANAAQCTMFVDLLNYGAAAQTKFDYNADKLVNAGLSDEEKSWATQEDVVVTDNSDLNGAKHQLVLKSVVQLQAAFKPASPTDNGTCETAQELADNIIRGWNLGCSLSVVSKPAVSNFYGLIGMSTDDGQYSRSDYLNFDEKTGSVTLDWNLSSDGILNADESAMVSKIFVEQWNFALTEADYCTFTVKEFTYTLKSGEVVSLADKPITLQTNMSGGTGYILLAELAELQGLLVKDIKSMHCVMSFDGMNVGEPTPEKIAALETAWGNPVTTQEMIDAVVDRGFNLIRIQVSFLNHMDAEGNIDELWLDRVQEVVDYCMNAGVYCVINTSGYMWMTCNPADWEVQKPIYTNLWKQISERFAGYGEKLIFESCNEVLYAEGMWSNPPAEAYDVMHEIHQTFVDTVRAGGGYNETRNLMLNPYAAGYDYEMNKNFTLPTDTVEGHLLAQVHCYVPQDFTFNETNLGSTNFRYEWGTAQDKWQLGETLQGIKKRFIDELGIPVVIGEFGVAKRLSESEAAEYIGFYAEVADKYDIQLILFDDGLDIAVFDRNNLTWTRPQVIDVLFAQTTTAGVSTVEATAEAATNPMGGMTAKATYTNYKGEEKEVTLTVAESNGYAVLSLNNLSFADYRTLVTFTVYNADGTVAGTAVTSMESYASKANTVEDLAELSKALMKFCASAHNYLTTK